MKRSVCLSIIPPLFMLLAFAAGCGGSASPTPPAASTTAVAAVRGDCGSYLRSGPIAFNGIVVSAGTPVAGYPDYRLGWQVVSVRVEAAAAEASRAYSRGRVVDVNVIEPFFPIIAPGDCVAVAGSERGFPCVVGGALGCANFGFVADNFDVLSLE